MQSKHNSILNLLLIEKNQCLILTNKDIKNLYNIFSLINTQSPLTSRHPRLRQPHLYGIVLESPYFNPFISLLNFPATKAPCNKANSPLRPSNDGPLGGFNPPLRHLLCFFLKSVKKLLQISKIL